ncbi:Lpp/OprI family alanine-zipper lipoprotein [Psychromonas sp. MME2]|uniref:Lpp/OprI family alanine-zipper lipoprotein n=1 Tax=unclassified Psychromonas TaxID=2614957 RepID=UPI00339BB3A0
MNNKLTIAGIILATTVLGGCVSKADLDASVAQTNKQISELSAKVDGLAADHARMEAETEANTAIAEAAAMEAERANLRVDSIVESYKK